jgi:signal transduction histidine kinase
MLFSSTSLYRDHPVLTVLYIGAMLARLLPRPLISLFWRRGGSGRTQFPRWMVMTSVCLLSIPTGLYTGFVINHYGFDNWNTLFMAVFALLCAVTGASSLAPDLRLSVVFETTLLAPIITSCFSANVAHAAAAGLAMTLFSVYMLIHALRLNAEYWIALTADLALKARAEELHTARVAAEAASQAKSQFLANMSHEIRTPMNGVLGMLELVLATKLGAEQRENLGYARQSAQCLLELLNDLLDLAKAEAGKISLEQIDFAVREVATGALSPFLTQANTKGIALTCSVDEAVPQALRGDPTRVRQVLMNLISNAVKFTPSGSIAVSIEVDAIEASTTTTVLHFRVADSGPGIPPEKQEAIFQAFSQGDDSVTRRFGGTGLGLAICRDLVTMMGGHIWAESAPGKGSTFHFTARFAAPSAAGARERQALETVPPPSRPLRVLVAEDNLVNQKVLTRLLEKAGHEFELAHNGDEALSLWRQGGFDLVLMDVQMPILDGLEATRRIRAGEAAGGEHVPIVGVTAGASTGEIDACIASGMDTCITKPITIPALDNVLARASRGLLQ